MAITTAVATEPNTDSITLEAAPEITAARCICLKFQELQDRIFTLEEEVKELKKQRWKNKED